MVKRAPVLATLGLFALLLVVAACVSEVDRGETPTVAPPTLAPTAAPTPTTATPVPSLPPTLAPTPSPSVTPSPTLTPVPTVEPVPQLVLDVRAPQDGIAVRTDAVVVHGVTSPGARVLIKGVSASVDADGGFQAEVALAPGINIILIVATDSAGHRETRDLAVTSLALPPQPFLLLVTEPEDQSIVTEQSVRLSGRTGPEAITSVNGVSVTVDELGFFSTTVTLEPGPNIIDVVATDPDGRVLSTVIAVIYRP